MHIRSWSFGLTLVVGTALLAAGPERPAAHAQNARAAARRSPPPAARGDAAPRECVRTAVGLLEYLLDARTRIESDAAGQKRWLTRALRGELEEATKRSEEARLRQPDEKVDAPSTSTFLLAWDHPTAFRVVGSRRYGDRAVVDVELSWGPNTNYPGDRRLQSYVFAIEDGAWRLDDAYCHRGAYAQPGSISEELRGLPGSS